MWEDHRGHRCDLWSSFWRPLARSPRSASYVHVGFVLAPGFGRLRCGVRGSGLPDELTQELKPGEEELPDHVPTCRAQRNVHHSESKQSICALMRFDIWQVSGLPVLTAPDKNRNLASPNPLWPPRTRTYTRAFALKRSFPGVKTQRHGDKSSFRAKTASLAARLTEPDEEQRADERGQDDQQGDPDALPHLSWGLSALAAWTKLRPHEKDTLSGLVGGKEAEGDSNAG